MTMTEPLFFEPEVLEALEKTAGEVDLPEDPNQWPQEILQELYKQVPYISDFQPHVEMQKVDAEQGYGIGHIEIQNQTEAPNETDPQALEATGVRTVRIPFVIKQSKLSPFDLLVTDSSRVLPLTENRLRQAIFRPQAFDVTSRTPGDQSMIGQLYPPYRQNYGFGGGGMAFNAGGGMGIGKMGSALEEYVEKDEKAKEAATVVLTGGPSGMKHEDFAHHKLPNGDVVSIHKDVLSDFYKGGDDFLSQMNAAKKHWGSKVLLATSEDEEARKEAGWFSPKPKPAAYSHAPGVVEALTEQYQLDPTHAADVASYSPPDALEHNLAFESAMQKDYGGPGVEWDEKKWGRPHPNIGPEEEKSAFDIRNVLAPGSGKIRELRQKELARNAYVDKAMAEKKTASILQAILPTINRTDHANFCLEVEKCAADIYANRETIFDAAFRIVDAEPAPLLKEASWEGLVRPTVVQIQHVPGGYIVKEASHLLWDPKSALISRGEVVERFGVKIAADVDMNGAVTLAEDATAEGGDTKTDLRPISDFGLYKVRDELGREHVGFVVPNLLDTDGKPLPLQLFTNGTVSAVQADILGEPAGAGGNLPSGKVGGHGAFYTVDAEGKVQMTIPFELGGSFSMPGEPGVFNGETFDGTPVEVSLQPNIKTVMSTPDGRVLVPEGWSWLPLTNSQAVGLVGGEAAVETETPEEMEEKESHVVVRSDGQLFSFSGVPVEKLARDQKQDLDVDDAMFLLSGLGTHQGYGAEKLAHAAYSDAPISIKTGRAIGLKSELQKEASAKAEAFLSRFPQLKTPHMLKEAANFPDPSIVDTVLSLGFINPENILTFVSYLPDIEDAQSKLCELLLAARLGLQNIPQSSLERAIRSTEETIEGLKILAFQGA